jgi:hypothetical protein
LAVDSQAASSDERRRVAATWVRAGEAFEHVRHPVSVRVGANPANSRVELEPGDLLAAQLPHDDGVVTMWVVRDGDDLYVRSVNGRGSSWFRGAQSCHEARTRAGGVEKRVELVETDNEGDAVDAAYEAKYGRRYPTIVPSITAPQARGATLKLVPGAGAEKET